MINRNRTSSKFEELPWRKKRARVFLQKKKTDVHHDIPRCKQKTNTLWLFQKIKTICTRSKFQGCLYQHTEYLPFKSEQGATTTTDRQTVRNHLKNNFVCKFLRKVDLLGLGIWWSWQFPLQSASHQSNLNTNLHPNGFFVLPRDADVATTKISAANAALRAQAYGWHMRIWTMCSYIIFFHKKIPKKAYTNRWSWTCK